MKNEWVRYLNELGFSRTLVQRAADVYRFFELTAIEEIDDVFVTNRIDSDGRAYFENFWFFSKGYAYEAKNFIIEDNFDMALIHKNVKYWDLKKEDFDYFAQATRESRMILNVTLRSEVRLVLSASEFNCNKLRDVMRTYIVENFERVQNSD